jgi:hypothetical protein
MGGYRIYFLDEQRRIRAAQWFMADDDVAAMWIAERLSDACSDVCPAFDLWYMARRIGGGNGAARTVMKAEAVNERCQEMLVSVEESLRDSASRIAASRRLLDSLKRAKPEVMETSEAGDR